ncbi:MAG: efflux transporter outer rane subunit, partial [Phycisphaerales bacterium]|nr:efflux transporter outer rane subunit [Phycisphaerales bacterium]
MFDRHTRMAVVSAAASVLALTGGCTVGPDYKQPATASPAAFAVTAPATRPTSGPTFRTDEEPVTRWWAAFGDPVLTGLADDALGHNWDVARARANLREARELLVQSRFEQAPIVTADGGYQRQRFSRPNAFGADRNRDLYSAGFDATWELDLFGGLRREVEARRAEVQRGDEQLRFVRLSVVAELAYNYADLRGSQESLRIARENADNQRRTHQLTLDLLNGGRGTVLDSSRAKSQLETTLATIPALERAVELAAYRLSVLTGRPPAALVGTLRDAPAALPGVPRMVAIGDPAGMIRRRPDVRVAERTLAAATARVGVQTADLYPRLTFVGSFGGEATQLGNLGRGSDAFGFGPRLTWAAFDLGRVQARVRAAGAAADAQAAGFQQAVLSALEEVQAALAGYAFEAARLSHLIEAEASSRVASDLARQSYENGGIGDFLSVLDAERRVLESQQAVADSRTQT